MKSIDPLYHTKNRIVAVDIVRIMAAFIVMYEHIAYGSSISNFLKYHYANIFAYASPLFFILAGFFASRNITWKKAFHNSLWCLLPFFLWNAVSVLIYMGYHGGHIPENSNFFTQFGFQAFFHSSLNLFPELGSPDMPFNYPLWFMRDLIFLFLLSPFLAKWPQIIFPICLVLSLIPATAPYMLPNGFVCLTPNSITFFTLGCLLQTFSKERQKKVLMFYSPWFIVGLFSILVIDFLYFRFIYKVPYLNVSKTLLVAWGYYQIARWIEVHIPAATPFALKLAPVTFLTFAAHSLAYLAYAKICQALNPDWLLYDLGLVVPPLTFAALALFFFALKRWCPALLHLVAHYKLRPDDIKPKASSATN